MAVTRAGGQLGFNEYESRADPAFLAEVEAAHAALIAKKKAAAAKYGLPYSPDSEDPTPIGIDPESKKRVIKDSALSDESVQIVANAKRMAAYVPFDINAFLNAYPSAKVIQKEQTVQSKSGAVVFMKDGKEKFSASANERFSPYGDSSAPVLNVIDGQLSRPFVSSKAFDASKGEIPVILPYSAAEKALKLEPLDASTPTEIKYQRLIEVRERVGEITATYCYRNAASQTMIAQASSQQAEIKENQSQPGYVKPSVIYALPGETSCGPVAITSDTRTAAEKRQDAQRILYEKEIGSYIGEPEQRLVTVRGVGVTSELKTNGQWSIAEMTNSLFASWLGYGNWVIPADMLATVPAEARPEAIFSNSPSEASSNLFFMGETYYVEFADKEEARTLLKKSEAASQSGGGEVFAYPFGSGVLFVDELKSLFEKVLAWAFLVVGGVAIIILASIIGRTVSEGRRESAIFRAIGASRADIGAVYGMYVVLLGIRIVIFAAILSFVVALIIELLFWQEATFGARLAYAASDSAREFHLFDAMSPYLLWILGAIMAVSIIASIIPILLGARRRPIHDMRDDA